MSIDERWISCRRDRRRCYVWFTELVGIGELNEGSVLYTRMGTFAKDDMPIEAVMQELSRLDERYDDVEAGGRHAGRPALN